MRGRYARRRTKNCVDTNGPALNDLQNIHRIFLVASIRSNVDGWIVVADAAVAASFHVVCQLHLFSLYRVKRII